MDSAKKPNRLSWQAEWSCFGGAEQAQGRNDLLPLGLYINFLLKTEKSENKIWMTDDTVS